MYIETSRPRHRGDRARLVSSPFPQTVSSCLSFYYHMYGSTIGSLRIYQANVGPPASTKLLFSKLGNQVNLTSRCRQYEPSLIPWHDATRQHVFPTETHVWRKEKNCLHTKALFYPNICTLSCHLAHNKCHSCGTFRARLLRKANCWSLIMLLV